MGDVGGRGAELELTLRRVLRAVPLTADRRQTIFALALPIIGAGELPFLISNAKSGSQALDSQSWGAGFYTPLPVENTSGGSAPPSTRATRPVVSATSRLRMYLGYSQ